VPLVLMDSAANWIGYHLIAHLGLHKHFVERAPPVPRFLIIGQPTQAYFPPDPPAGARLPESDADRQAVTRMFEVLRDIVAQLAPRLRVLVLDHLRLDNPWFAASVVDEWRDGVEADTKRFAPRGVDTNPSGWRRGAAPSAACTLRCRAARRFGCGITPIDSPLVSK
jgi:hypothetical protein